MFSLHSSPLGDYACQIYSHYIYSSTPQTPSPLRTSRNVNLMSSPSRLSTEKARPGSILPQEFSNAPTNSSDFDAENHGRFDHARPSHVTPVGKRSGFNGHGQDSMLITPPASAYITASQFIAESPLPSVPAAFEFHRESPYRAEIKPSGWETRAKGAGSAAMLARHAAQRRATKKSSFLERIRNRRDESKSEGYGDQVLRMDFVRERRQWEAEMRRIAQMEASMADDEEEDIDMLEDPTTSLSPGDMSPVEDPDIDELVMQYEAIHQQRPAGDEVVRQNPDDYDRFCMEMLSDDPPPVDRRPAFE